jgi:MazG family protein
MESLTRLIEMMKLLRDPERGCPWDREQTLSSILPYTQEEVHELVDAVERADAGAIRSELGDLLFHIVFYARMAEEQGMFSLAEVAAAICDKLEQRHPHVFGGAAQPVSSAEQSRNWEVLKSRERAASVTGTGAGFLADIPATLPALLRATKLQKRAAGAGFDWPDLRPVLDKIAEELEELRAVVGRGGVARVQDEIGDLLFAVVNCARHAGVDPEAALRGANRKFERRFAQIERELARRGRALTDASLDEMEEIWQQAKRDERS